MLALTVVAVLMLSSLIERCKLEPLLLTPLRPMELPWLPLSERPDELSNNGDVPLDNRVVSVDELTLSASLDGSLPDGRWMSSLTEV